jgi:purine-binding chemotaxis protein CheW
MPELKDKNSVTFNNNNHIQYIIFELNNKSYGVNIDDVREVLNYLESTQIPLTTDNISGIINIRGIIIPVIDLSYRLYKKKTDIKKENIIVIETTYENRTVLIGALVDKIVSVAKISNKDINQNPDLGTDINHSFIENICRYQNNLILALNTNEVFNINELSKAEGLNIDYSEALSSTDEKEYSASENALKKEKQATLVKHIYFKVAEEKYSLAMNKISEIIKVPEITLIHNTLPFMIGVISLREHVIPVIDMRLRCGLPQSKYTRQTAILIVETQEKLTGLLVDEVLNINSIDEKSISKTMNYSLQIDRNFISGMFKDNEEIIISINEDKILSNEQFDEISKNMSENAKTHEASKEDKDKKIKENKPKTQKKTATRKSSKKSKTTDEKNLKNNNN